MSVSETPDPKRELRVGGRAGEGGSRRVGGRVGEKARGWVAKWGGEQGGWERVGGWVGELLSKLLEGTSLQI